MKTDILTDSTASDNQSAHCPAHFQFELPGAQLHLWQNWLNPIASAQLQQTLRQLNWQQPAIKLFGKSILIPRRQIWMGDVHCRYRYSGVTFSPVDWAPSIQAICQQVSQHTQTPLNCVLLNWYQDGQQHMGWHSDDEMELGLQPQVVSLSLGQVRRFDLKHKHQSFQLSIDLTNGALLLMAGGCQDYWQHRLPKQAAATMDRFSLTFRYIAAVS